MSGPNEQANELDVNKQAIYSDCVYCYTQQNMNRKKIGVRKEKNQQRQPRQQRSIAVPNKRYFYILPKSKITWIHTSVLCQFYESIQYTCVMCEVCVSFVKRTANSRMCV